MKTATVKIKREQLESCLYILAHEDKKVEDLPEEIILEAELVEEETYLPSELLPIKYSEYGDLPYGGSIATNQLQERDTINQIIKVLKAKGY